MEICPHLRPVLDDEIARGNMVLDSSQAWSLVKSAVSLKLPIDPENLKTYTSGLVQHWKNTDTHYPVEEGLLCTLCKHSLAGPIRDALNGDLRRLVSEMQLNTPHNADGFAQI